MMIVDNDEQEFKVTAYHKWLCYVSNDIPTTSGINTQVDYVAHELMNGIFQDNNPQAWALLEYIRGEYGNINFPDDFYTAAKFIIDKVNQDA